MTTDEELLAAWRAGDRVAGSALVRRHFAAVSAFIRARAPEIAEDLTQQTFLVCAERLMDLRDPSNVRGYLLVIARNLVLSHHRRAGNRLRNDAVDVNAMPGHEPSPTSVVLLREDEALVAHALRQLPAELRAVLALYYEQQLDADAVAQRIGAPLGTVRSRIRRGLERLRAQMAKLDLARRTAGAATMRCQSGSQRVHVKSRKSFTLGSSLTKPVSMSGE